MEEVKVIEFATYGVTDIHPLALVITLLAGLSLFFLKRALLFWPVLIVICMLPQTQRVVILSLDFTMIRILAIFAIASMFYRGRSIPRMTGVDYAIILWCVIASITYVIREADFSAVVYRVGFCFEILSMYFWMRATLRDHDDCQFALVALAFVSIFIALGVSMELMTSYNMFSIFGGVDSYTTIRDGRLRCQAAFSHAVLLGAFGATTLPLMIGLFITSNKYRLLSSMAIVACMVNVGGSASSGPLFALVAGFMAWALWPMRNNMRVFRWALVGAILFVHFIREKPVWHLIGRASDLVGGTGYHRVKLFDAYFVNFKDWVLVGTENTAYWGYGLQDVTNQYMLESVNGGILATIAFIAIIVAGYKQVGRNTSNGTLTKSTRLWWWAAGACLSAHTVSLVGISYFGQIWIVLAFHLAMLSSLVSETGTAKQPELSAQPNYL